MKSCEAGTTACMNYRLMALEEGLIGPSDASRPCNPGKCALDILTQARSVAEQVDDPDFEPVPGDLFHQTGGNK